jgi:DNA-binding transcriptional LysR family regulator
MARESYNDLLAFLVVARARSFTRAAAQLGVSPSALSHSMRGLEERLGVRLLTRTTRSVSPTDAGERLLNSIGPRFDEVDAALIELGDMRDEPAGNFRVTAGDHAAHTILWPKLASFLMRNPAIKVEINIESGLIDIAAERYDAGVRLGDQVAKDMVSVRIGPDVRFAVIGTKAYLAKNPPPKTPRELVDHTCINMRLATHGAVWPWEFEKGGRELKVRVQGQLVFNNIFQIRDAALAGFGLAYVPEDLALTHLAKGQLVRVLDDWCPCWSGYHLYYPSRRQSSAAFALLIEALRHRS